MYLMLDGWPSLRGCWNILWHCLPSLPFPPMYRSCRAGVEAAMTLKFQPHVTELSCTPNHGQHSSRGAEMFLLTVIGWKAQTAKRNCSGGQEANVWVKSCVI